MKDETKLKLLLFRNRIQVALSPLAGRFNRKIEGVRAEYDLNYCNDGSHLHTLDLMRPEGKDGLPCVIYLHGGGWSSFDKKLFRSTCKRLAACGAAVLNCNVRLAPKSKIEDMLNDIASVCKFAEENAPKWGIDANRLIFAGDSSGAHLLALFLGRAVKEGNPVADRVKGCAYFYGAFDLNKFDEKTKGRFGTYMYGVFPRYMPSRPMYLYSVSPVNYISGNLPPHLICSGETDRLHRPQSVEYYNKLREAGVPAEALFFPADCKKAKHRFMTFDKNPAAKQAFERFAVFLHSL